MSTSLRGATLCWRLARHASSSTSRAVGRHAPRQPLLTAPTLGRFATTSTDPASSTDPSFSKALELLGEGTRLIEEGDVEGALGKYQDSVRVKETSGGYFNLGVCEYTQNNHQAAIDAWEKSIKLGPSADAYTNLASAYIMLKPPQAALAIKHLTSAMELAPDDPEIAFNLAAILESTGNLDSSLKMYERAEQGGIARAAQNIRSVSAKILTAQATAKEAA